MANKTISVVLDAPITYNGEEIAKGEVIELPEKSAKSLIKEQTAREVRPADEDVVRQALDEKYSDLADLKKAAEAAGVEFAANATKAKVIDAIIEQGKVDAL
ncbi:hypothetical protein M3221_13570 [Domibacillus indicus]|uniref:DUF7210 family protein n=1 Tax=Domibacillus indicus TaxID=1437523 RepID=UPI00203B5B67|nr:hypothetical protein [Domibacillus indicus]MCM3789429.1 hypothetical protein [Domibacillus indicus]